MFLTDFQIVVQFLLPLLLCLHHCGRGGLHEDPCRAILVYSRCCLKMIADRWCAFFPCNLELLSQTCSGLTSLITWDSVWLSACGNVSHTQNYTSSMSLKYALMWFLFSITKSVPLVRLFSALNEDIYHLIAYMSKCDTCFGSCFTTNFQKICV